MTTTAEITTTTIPTTTIGMMALFPVREHEATVNNCTIGLLFPVIFSLNFNSLRMVIFGIKNGYYSSFTYNNK